MRELKDEKQKRWQLEDQLHAVQADAAIMTKDMLILRKQLEDLQLELRDERKLHEATASKLEDVERCNNSLQQQLTVQREQAEATQDDRLDAEASVEKVRVGAAIVWGYKQRQTVCWELNMLLATHYGRAALLCWSGLSIELRLPWLYAMLVAILMSLGAGLHPTCRGEAAALARRGALSGFAGGD